MNVQKPQGSLISYFSRCAREMDGINLAQGKPGFAPPAELIELVKEISDQPELHQYAPGNGNVKLLELLTQVYRPLQPINMDHLLIVQGATEGLFQVFFYLKQMLSSSFGVLSFDPVYESYPKLAQFFQLPFEYFPLEEDLSVDFHKLETCCRDDNIKIIFLASPGNPLGKVWQNHELEILLDMAQRLNIYVIFDAVYKDIYFTEKPCNPLIFRTSNLFYVASFSKMLSVTGWRVGYIIADLEHMKKIRAIHDYVGLCAPTLFQEVIYQYLSRYDLAVEYTAGLRKKCLEHFSYLKGELEKISFYVPETGGGYFIWTRIPQAYKDGFTLAVQLLNDTAIGVVPGENFSPSHNNYIRLNFTVAKPVLQAAVKSLRTVIKKD